MQGESARGDGVALWLVLDADKLVGVISAFELM